MSTESHVVDEVGDAPMDVDGSGGSAPTPWPRGKRVARFALWLGLIAVAGLGLRVTYVLVAKADGVDACGAELCGDAIYYSAQAETIADGGWYEDPFRPGEAAADHPPLTALVAAPASWLPGGPVVPQRLTMALVGSGVVVAIGLLGRIVGGDRVGLFAAVLAAGYPNLWMNDGVIMSESLATLGAAVCLLMTYRLIRGPTPAAAAWLGIVTGVTILARAEMALYLPIVVVPVLLWRTELDLWARLGRIALAGGLAAALLVPWTTYNLTRFERPVLMSTNDGLTLLGANCDDVYHGGGTGFWSLECGIALDADGDQSEVSAENRTAALDYIGDNIGRVPAVVAVRVGRVWGVYAPDQMVWYNLGEGRERLPSQLGMWSYDVLVLAAIAGIVLLRRRRTPVWPLVGMAVIVTLTAALFYGLARFRVPAEVSIVVLASVVVDTLVDTLERRRRGSVDPATRPDDGSRLGREA